MYFEKEFTLDAPELDESELSKTTQVLEMMKPNFVETFEPSFVEGRVGFYCNNCFGLEVAFVNAFAARCYTRPSARLDLHSM